jgi:MFS family permease
VAQEFSNRDEASGDPPGAGAIPAADPSKSPSNTLSPQRMAALLATVTAVQGLSTFAVLALPTLATRASATFGVGAEAVGYQISIVYLAGAALSSIAGLFVRRWGAALTSIVALTLTCAGVLAMASGQLALTIAASAALGCGYALTNPAASHLLFRFAPRHRQNLVFALKQTGVPMGGVVAALLLPPLAERVGWQAAMAIGAGLLAVVIVPLAFMRTRLDDDRDPTFHVKGGMLAGVLLVARHPRLRALAVMGLTYASFQFCLFAFLITMLAQDFGWSLIAAGQMATGMQIGGVIGRIAWSVLADRIGHGLDLLVGIGIASAAFALTVATATGAWPVWLLAVVLFGFGFCLVGWNGLWMAEIARACHPQEVGLATGGVLVFTFSGNVVGPLLFGTVAAHAGGFSVAYALLSLPLAAAGVLLHRMRV